MEKVYLIFTKALAAKFFEAMNLYSSVVPSTLLNDIMKDIKIQTSVIESMLGAGEVELLKSVYAENLKLLERMADMECTYRKQVNKEIQRNDFCFQRMKGPMSDLGFIPKSTIKQCNICLYGKSLIYLYFYKDGEFCYT